jgi:hypothetical protein
MIDFQSNCWMLQRRKQNMPTTGHRFRASLVVHISIKFITLLPKDNVWRPKRSLFSKCTVPFNLLKAMKAYYTTRKLRKWSVQRKLTLSQKYSYWNTSSYTYTRKVFPVQSFDQSLRECCLSAGWKLPSHYKTTLRNTIIHIKQNAKTDEVTKHIINQLHSPIAKSCNAVSLPISVGKVNERLFLTVQTRIIDSKWYCMSNLTTMETSAH